MVLKLRTSKETMTIFEEIGLSLHLQPFALCKIAIALSLRVDDKLNELGAVDGDTVTLCDFEFDYYE